ncbi:MAG TPA: SMI1/KNR4 family protein [Leptolyngbyaceae cyanobacterium M33_DOE_097]|uniref:SMI1/KNR4 family protein n=1 Tax=Oscillatoriales cyanobacterium SpSt-418 TaxID=2282169 RepID=A0A7C3PAH3_9CYAN|nr:SMI1/KNR4 family protein [Leptolyngbyaceae cyanobacterium M33_DOE_097]
MIEQWQDLLAQLEIINSGREVYTSDELLRFEAEDHITLPTGYKEYARVFGTGLLGYGMHVYAPSLLLVEYSQATLEECFLEQLKRFPLESEEKTASLKELFKNAFVFADDSGAHVALWDLRTFGDDENYDIYWVDIDLIDEEYRIGRDFFEFISGFCLGRSSYDFLPEEKRPSSDTPQRFNSFARRR